MSIVDVALMAHLRRRAGFGATRDELEAYVAKGYEATVEELLNPGNPESLPDDHDDGVKTFLGETGRFNGEDIIVRNPTTARFVGRRLFQFFVADEVYEEGEALIDVLTASYLESNYEIRSVLRTLFNSQLFKSERVRFARVKSPVELVVGILRLSQEFGWPNREIHDVAMITGYMGQELMNPASVEGWHEGAPSGSTAGP